MLRLLFLYTVLLLSAVVACSQDQGSIPPTTVTAGQAATPTAQALHDVERAQIPQPPDADSFEITRRLRLKSGGPFPQAMKAPPPPQEVGREEVFTVTDLQSYARFPVTATLRVVTPHAYWYVDKEMTVEQRALENSANKFEADIYPTDVRIFGDTIVGGFDGDPHLTILTTSFKGAAGYYSSPDEYPTVVHSYSNQRLMLYINGNSLRPGSVSFNSVVTHELQHAIHWHADPNEESWVNEGLSVLAEDLNGFRPSVARIFEQAPEVQLTLWEDAPADNGPHYAAAYLFFKFLGQHWGGYDKLKELVAEPADGVDGVNAYLRKLGSSAQFRDVFKDWVVANAGGDNIDPRYKYDGLQVRAQAARRISADETFSDQVRQYAAKYIEVKPESRSVELAFSGSPVTKLLPTEAHSGQRFWWSNRGDSTDSTLTRGVDLSQVTAATLRFWTWFDIEKGWDYAYVEVSEDGGATWTILPGTHASRDDPLGNSYGPGYTGKSGEGGAPQWEQESVDLTPYAGKKVLLRFEYITDEAVNSDGLALDDIEIPEVGFRDDAESENGWMARGFFHTDNLVAQDFIVQVLEQRSGGATTVRDIPLDGPFKGNAQLCCFGQDLERAEVIVAALAPATTAPAAFELSVKTGR